LKTHATRRARDGGRASARAKSPDRQSRKERPTEKSEQPLEEQWSLRLYVAGQSVKCLAAVRNLNAFCEEHLAGRYRIEVLDLLENPKLARDDQILAIPTLVRKVPEPLRKIVGDLSSVERMLVGFDLRPVVR